MRYPKQGEKYNVEVFNDNFREVEKTLSQKSGMIVTEHSGAMILANGTAAAPIQGLSVFGKSEQDSTTGANLWPYGDITGVAGSNVFNGSELILPAGTYTLKCNVSANNGSSSTITFYDSNDNSVKSVDLRNDNIYNEGAQYTFELASDCVSIVMHTRSDATYSNVMLNAGDTALPWEPYTGGKASPNPDYPQEVVSPGDAGSLEIGVYGGNLIPYPYIDTTKTTNGITFTDNGDGSITVNGTATGRNATFELYKPTATDKFENTFISGAKDTNCIFEYTNKRTITFADTGSGKAITFTHNIADFPDTVFHLQVNSGKTVNNVTIYPMLNAGDTALPWEPYTKQSASIAVTGGLPAIPVDSGGLWTDENGQQWVGDYIDVERGVRVHNVGVIDFNGLVCVMNEYLIDSGIYRFEFRYADNPNIAPSAIDYITTGYCTALSYRFNPLGYNDVDNAIAVYDKGGFYARCDQFETADDFLAHMQSIDAKVYYILAEPYETELSAEEIEAFLDLRTNKPVTTIMNDAGAYMEAELVADTKLYIDAKIEELKAALGG